MDLPTRGTDTALEKTQHGLAGVDYIRGESRVGCQQTCQEASIAVPQDQSTAGPSQMAELGIAAALEQGTKAQVFEPAVGTGDRIEINGQWVKRLTG